MDYDAELQLHNEALFRASAIRRHEHVLDIGCGAGKTTRDAARLAANGSALGVDITATMVARARELAQNEGLRNVRFAHGDAQLYDFPSQQFDIAISRYGTMFFDDPTAAFSNIRGALRPTGRLVMMVWQAHELNAWSVAIEQVFAPYNTSSTVPSGAGDHFSLADPGTVERILTAAGLAGATISDERTPVYYGASVDAAIDWVRGFRFVRNILLGLDADSARRALERLRETLAKNSSETGVWFDAREWIVTAERR